MKLESINYNFQAENKNTEGKNSETFACMLGDLESRFKTSVIIIFHRNYIIR